MELPVFGNLEITGDISVEPLTGRIPLKPHPILCLIMGPTGSGKSSFIESLAGASQKLSISKDQLAGYTQSINAYRVVNVASTVYTNPRPVYLVDTPGFSDAMISEVEIINMVKKWLEKNDLDHVHAIHFFIPVTETRLPGSRRRTIEMLKRLLTPGDGHLAVTFVTTMWDTLHNERTQERAESNFEQLRDKVCKEFFGEYGVSIIRFMNTKKSALEALNSGRYTSVDSFSEPISSASPNLYQDLHERIECALRVKQMIASDLSQPEAHTNTELRDILEKNQMENHETLTKFIRQLISFGPLPPGFYQAAQRLRKAIAVQITPEDAQLDGTFQQWAQEPEIFEEPIPESEHSSSAQSLPRSFKHLALNGLLRRLLNAAKHRGSKWFKHGA